MSETNNQITIAKILTKTIDGIHTVVPIKYIDSVSCLHSWLGSCHRMSVDLDSYVTEDYYNGSDNDLQNIFLEIINLATSNHCYNGHYVLKRLEFLANEGLHIVDIQGGGKSFKLKEDEINNVILSLSNKTKKVSKAQVKKNVKKAVELYKKNVKSSVGLKPLKKKKPAKRDMKGRFSKNK
jgi:hypothetical protein